MYPIGGLFMARGLIEKMSFAIEAYSREAQLTGGVKSRTYSNLEHFCHSVMEI